MAIATTDEILDFWFSDEVTQKWFEKDEDFDKEIKKRFLSTYNDAKKKRASMVGDSAEDMLARVLVLDQFPRNMFRGTKEAFVTDGFALRVATDAIKKKYDRKLTDDQKKFLFMPFMHSEDLKDQRTAVALFSRVKDKDSLEFAVRHKEVILRFNRFPHRNDAMNRASSEQEEKFLAKTPVGY